MPTQLRILGLRAAAAAMIPASIIGYQLPALAADSSARPANLVVLAVGSGHDVQLGETMADAFVGDTKIADVKVSTSRNVQIIGKSPGETTVLLLSPGGRVLFSATVRVQ